MVDLERLLNAQDNLRYAFGEYFELYKLDSNILTEVYSNPEKFGLKNRYCKKETFGAQFGCRIISKIIKQWESDNLFTEIITANKRWNNPDDIHLYEYLTTTSFDNIKACRILYDKICRYLYREVEYRSELMRINPNCVYNFWRLCSFLIKIYTTCLKASNTYQSIFYDKIELIFYSGFYEMNQSLTYWCTQYLPDRDKAYENIANLLYQFYTIYKFDYGYLTRKSAGLDLYMTAFLKHNSDHQQWIDNVIYQTIIRLISLGEKTLPIVTLENVYIGVDLASHIEVVSENAAGFSQNDIIVFGDKDVTTSFLGKTNIDRLKNDLLCLTADKIRSYIKKNENTRINFTIPEQFKSYLQIELQCKMLVVNLKKGNELQQSTILHYEGEKFLLFVSEDESDTLYGISLFEDENTKERKIFTMDKDEEVTYRILFNEIEE